MSSKQILNRAALLAGLLLLILGVEGDLQIVTRAEWKAKPAAEQMTTLELPVQRVIIAHTAGKECKTKVSQDDSVRYSEKSVRDG